MSFIESKTWIGHCRHTEIFKRKNPTDVQILDFESRQLKETGLLSLTRGYTGADIERAIRVSLLKAIQKSVLEYQDLITAMEFVGGTRSHVEQQSKLSGNDLNVSEKRVPLTQSSEKMKPREI